MSAERRCGLYDDFAAFYDRDWAAAYLEDAAPGFEHVLLPRLAQGDRVLDLCCGSGRLAAWLTKRGFRVTGLDESETMLALAQVRAPECELVLGDARTFAFEESFDAVVSTFDSINHFADISEIRAVFGCVARALAAGGLFFFDVNTEAGFEDAGDESYHSIQDDEVCFVRSLYDGAAGVGTAHVILFRKQGDLYRRSETKIREYFHPIADLAEALEDAGFESPALLDAQEDLAMPRAQGRLFFATRKRAADAADARREDCAYALSATRNR